MGKNKVVLPKISKDLAYICGLLVGDGHLCLRPIKKEYSIFFSGNLNDEKEFYTKTIVPLLKDLFGVQFRIKINKNDNTINLVYYSKDLLEFLSENIGIPVGSKCDKISTPPMFKKSEALFKSFLQGYADADFCLCLKKRYTDINYYPVISCRSRSSKIIEEIGEFLHKLGFKYYIDLDRPFYDKRIDKNIIMSTITIYGHNNLIRWMKEIGFRNYKALKNFEIWKERNLNNPRAKYALSLVAGVGIPLNYKV
jgi:hypothetical protein